MRFSAVGLLALVVGVTGFAGSAVGQSRHRATFAPGTYQLLSFFPQKNYDAWLRDQIKRFESTHKGVTIKVQYTNPTYIIQKIRTAVASGSAPDVATELPGAAQTDLWQAGRLLDLTPYIRSDPQWQRWIKGWNKVPSGQYRLGSHIFASNVSLGPEIVWYWKDVLAKAGYRHFPTTISGLLQLTKALSSKGLPAMAVAMNSQALINFDVLFYILEANFDPGGAKARLADEGKYPWTAAPMQKAAALLKKLYDAGVFVKGAISMNYDPDQKVAFGEKRASSAYIFGPWMDGYYPASDIPNIGVALFPYQGRYSTLASSNDLEFIIPVVTNAQKETAHRETMVAFVKQLSSPESQQALWQDGIFPVMPSAVNAPSKNIWAPILKAQIKLAQHAHAAIDFNTYSSNTDAALTNGLQGLMLGQMSVSQLLLKVQAANKQDHACAPKC